MKKIESVVAQAVKLATKLVRKPTYVRPTIVVRNGKVGVRKGHVRFQ